MTDFVHYKYNLYSDKHTERTKKREPGSTGSTEQGLPAQQDELENLSEALRNSVFIAYYSDRVFCHFPLYPDVLHPAGVQEEQYHQAAVVRGLGQEQRF